MGAAARPRRVQPSTPPHDGLWRHTACHVRRRQWLTPQLVELDWRAWRTRFVLFTGKGGVGKTTIAAATAVALADAGRRVLLVSTDPASNLTDVFQMATGEHPTSVRHSFPASS